MTKQYLTGIQPSKQCYIRLGPARKSLTSLNEPDGPLLVSPTLSSTNLSQMWVPDRSGYPIKGCARMYRVTGSFSSSAQTTDEHANFTHLPDNITSPPQSRSSVR
jgi:hypothetical protein